MNSDMFHCNENCAFKFRLLFLLLTLLATIVAADKIVNRGELNDVQKNLLRLFDKPLRRDTGRSEKILLQQPKTTPKYEIKPEVWTELTAFDFEEPFSPTIKKHGRIAADLIQIFLDMPTYQDLLAIARQFRSFINPGMFNYALSVALVHRNDTRTLPIPTQVELFPDMFIDSRTIFHAEKAAKYARAGEPIDIWKNYSTASNREVEHRLAYFREDIAVNLHHWNWHLAYPYDGDPKIVIKDRRGELFYYMHQQFLARYNTERLSNQLTRAKRLTNFREPIPEGYFPKLDSRLASRCWPSRPSGSVLRDIKRPEQEVEFDVQDLERWTNRIYEAINTGTILGKHGEQIPLTEKEGIDLLGNVIEASPVLSPNFDHYGSIHNFGHYVIAYSHDPDNSHLESFGVMGISSTSMRDPVFYRLHAFIDQFFVRFKNTLESYSEEQLNYPGIKVSGVQVVSQTGKINHLDTFWSYSDIDISRGLDLADDEAHVRVRFTHLNHTSFEYKIVASNELSSPKKGTVRIFMAPKYDEDGLPFSFHEQKHLMIEMDKFNIKLHPGENIIERNSTDSSLTLPFEVHSHQLDLDTIPSLEKFCGCGWPQHMLVPKGTKDGLPMELFVMISDDTGDFITHDELTGCKTAATFCGLRDRKYPDARAMGYPFDRKPRKHVQTLSQFLTTNMATTEIRVQFTDKVL